MPDSLQYTVDDRGDRAQFYLGDEIVATLNREATVNGVPDQHSWDGDPDVTLWAIAHDYPEVETAARI